MNGKCGPMIFMSLPRAPERKIDILWLLPRQELNMDHKPFYKALGIVSRIENEVGGDSCEGIINLIKYHLTSVRVSRSYFDNLMSTHSRTIRELKAVGNVAKDKQCYDEGWGWGCCGEHYENHISTPQEIIRWRKSVAAIGRGGIYKYKEFPYWRNGVYKTGGMMCIIYGDD